MSEKISITQKMGKNSQNSIGYQSLATSELFSSISSSIDSNRNLSYIQPITSSNYPQPTNLVKKNGVNSYEVSHSIQFDPYDSYACNTSDNHQFHGKKLGLASLVVLSFYTVCGGPFGIEDIVRAGGPLYAILGFGLIFIWAVPEAMITAELSVAMPESSGSVAWVDAAFGSFWAFQKGWLSWLSGIADNALYPILFLDCLLQMSVDDNGNNFLSGDDGTIRWSLLLSITTILTYLNYRGLEVVGKIAVVICLLSLAPFAVFCVLGLPQVDPRRWFATKPGGIKSVDWRLLLNTFFWNINFWESSSSFSADVEDPAQMYPKGMSLAVILVFLSLLLPVLVGIGASNIKDEPYEKWTDGFFVHLGTKIVGPWLGYWMTFAAMITNIGMFEAEMSSDAWQVAGMADKGILPAFLSTRNKYGSPTYGVLLSAMGVIALGWLAFGEVIDMLNLLYCYGQLIEFTAYLWIRYKQSQSTTMAIPYTTESNEQVMKPIKFYLNVPLMTALLLLPFILIFIILYFSTWLSLLVSVILALSGIGMHYLLLFMKEHEWCTFHDCTS